MSYIRYNLVRLATAVRNRFVLTLAIVTIALQLSMAPALATALYEIPAVSAGVPTWVIDKADVLSLSTKGKIKGTLEQLAKDTGKEVRFVTIHRLDYGETIQTFTDKLFKKWFPDAEQQANQTLIVLDNVTNTIGIQSGDGVKSTLTDAIAKSVINETMQVPLRDGNKYNQSFDDAATRLVAVISGQADPGPPVIKSAPEVGRTYLKAEETEANRGSFTIVVIGLLIAATIIPMATWWWYQTQD
jgi:uncharacterized protein